MQFDKPIQRRGTECVKWDGHGNLGVPEDAVPLWVADMDFAVPSQVTQALQQRTEHEVYGYPLPGPAYFQSIQGWMARRHNWDIDTQWIATVPGVVPAINLAINAFSQPGDSILVQPPVYPPFIRSAQGDGRNLVTNPLVLEGDSYRLDIEDFESKIVSENVKIFILCSPHNPVGRVWTPEELRQMADICQKHQVLIVSDEIHQDLIYPGQRHYPVPALDAAYNEFTIVLTAPSKTFNLAGLQAANAIIPNANLKQKFVDAASRWGLGKVNSMGLVACQAAYTHGDQWLDGVLDYLAANKSYVANFLEQHLPQLRLVQSQALYLLWLDCSALDITQDQLQHFFLHQAKLWLNSGCMFGQEGEGFMRMNIACPRSVLVGAMEQLKQAFKEL